MVKFKQRNMGVIILMASLMGILSGCSKAFAKGASEFVNSRTRQLDRETDRDKKHFVEMLDNIFKALDNKDKQGLKNLFAVNVIKSNSNLDKQIDDLFLFYKGPYEGYEGLSIGSLEDWDHGVKKTSLFNGNNLIVTVGDIKYQLNLRIQSRNDENKDEEGMQWLEFATEEAYNNKKYFMWYSSPGIYIQTSPEKRGDVIIVNSKKLEYKIINRHLTVDDFLTFISNNDEFNSLIKSIGEPNAVDTYFGNNYFELENKQFVVCTVGKWDDEGKIQVMCVSDEDRELYTLWTRTND